jgi:hypothetical protein
VIDFEPPFPTGSVLMSTGDRRVDQASATVQMDLQGLEDLPEMARLGPQLAKRL